MQNKLIVTIVQKNYARKVLKATKEAGAEGGTVILGVGTGTNKLNNFFGMTVDPDKEIIFTLANENNVDVILEAAINSGKLFKAGYGIAFVINVKEVAGIVHLLNIQGK